MDDVNQPIMDDAIEVTTEPQHEFFAYDAEGNFVGVQICTQEQFAKTGFVEGANPHDNEGVTVRNILDEYDRRWSGLLNAGTSRTSVAEATARRNELSSELNGYNGLLLSDGTLTDEQKARHAILTGGALKLRALEKASQALAAMSPIPDDYADDKWWA
ncbi:MAG: hypothetical protein JKY93_03400 [Gammaproteobacteria bacterium]|nr:hypothetical protein [Gammaproteobacteria bacterium]